MLKLVTLSEIPLFISLQEGFRANCTPQKRRFSAAISSHAIKISSIKVRVKTRLFCLER